MIGRPDWYVPVKDIRDLAESWPMIIPYRELLDPNFELLISWEKRIAGPGLSAVVTASQPS